jgi:hypothetical protein
MDEYAARAKRIYGGWEVTVAGVPAATFRHRHPTDEMIYERLAVVLGRSDFRINLACEDA